MNDNYLKEESELFAEVDMLVEWVRANAPQTQILNLPRYREVALAKSRLDLLLKAINAGPSSLEVNPLFASATLIVEAESLEVCNIAEFTEIVGKANNFEVYPLKNGKLRLAIVFYRVMHRI